MIKVEIWYEKNSLHQNKSELDWYVYVTPLISVSLCCLQIQCTDYVVTTLLDQGKPPNFKQDTIVQTQTVRFRA